MRKLFQFATERVCCGGYAVFRVWNCNRRTSLATIRIAILDGLTATMTDMVVGGLEPLT